MDPPPESLRNRPVEDQPIPDSSVASTVHVIVCGDWPTSTLTLSTEIELRTGGVDSIPPLALALGVRNLVDFEDSCAWKLCRFSLAICLDCCDVSTLDFMTAILFNKWLYAGAGKPMPNSCSTAEIKSISAFSPLASIAVTIASSLDKSGM